MSTAVVRVLLAKACVELAATADALIEDIEEFGDPMLEPLLDELVVTADLVRLGERPPIELEATRVVVDAALDWEGLWADERELAALFVARTEIRRWVEVVHAGFETAT